MLDRAREFHGGNPVLIFVLVVFWLWALAPVLAPVLGLLVFIALVGLYLLDLGEGPPSEDTSGPPVLPMPWWFLIISGAFLVWCVWRASRSRYRTELVGRWKRLSVDMGLLLYLIGGAFLIALGVAYRFFYDAPLVSYAGIWYTAAVNTKSAYDTIVGTLFWLASIPTFVRGWLEDTDEEDRLYYRFCLLFIIILFVVQALAYAATPGHSFIGTLKDQLLAPFVGLYKFYCWTSGCV